MTTTETRTPAEWERIADKHFASAEEAFTVALAFSDRAPNPGLERAEIALKLAQYALNRAHTA
ncbi:hypothetical protein ACFC26_09625 [Kitasatospora purpeofusca]|uniref:hypothetical protein n=1 Tax=Kitasatospora purpeofusca TaxID=67352 RepID=UPI0035D6775B